MIDVERSKRNRHLDGLKTGDRSDVDATRRLALRHEQRLHRPAHRSASIVQDRFREPDARWLDVGFLHY